ncbi:hypothetical protein EZJ43_05185 [Pedobacter changchengzhani]|uniref:Tetratricopeptide repeat protein n=1 Tax=Pedobacter changchengzhani TaxID=2529274 RepID=A0A4R5MLS7_9SPHI|nr:hypothetical protein [Pedobacter changchengzhani]TDG36680.1 hypothetical protein EZJ43_05185 [Pedobacter changchengzhani]
MTDDKILLTARYVEGDMDAIERAGYETQMENDADLQQHLIDYNYIHESLKMKLAPDDADLLFRDTLSKFNSEYFHPQQVAKTISLKPYVKWLSGIAAVLFLGLLIWAPWRMSLYESFAGNNQMTVAERGAEKETNLDKAAAFYNVKDYKSAKILLEKEHVAQPENAMVNYYYGKTLLETQQIGEGRVMLNGVYNGQSVFKYDAAYAVAMSYLKADNKDACRIWLQKIPAGTAHFEQAKALLEKL